MKSIRKQFIILLVSVIGSASLAGGVSTALDVNDVSFFFPLKNKTPYPAISLSQDLKLPAKIFEQVLKFENKTASLERLPYLDGKFVGSIKQWYVTSFRFETCGEVFSLEPTIDPINRDSMLIADRASGCQARFRVVAQPFNFFGFPVATAMHLIFKVDQNEIPGIVTSLMKIKSLAKEILSLDTTGLPLTQHPALVAEAATKQTEIADSIRSTLLDGISGSDNRLEIVTLTLQYVIDSWRFVGGYVQEGSWKKFVTRFSKQFNDFNQPSIQLGVEELSCNRIAVCLFRPTFQPAELVTPGLVVTQIFRDIPEMIELQIPGHRNTAIQKESEIIDNSTKTHFFNTNCVSCHSSSNLRDPNTLHTDLDIPKGVTPFVPKKFTHAASTNIINFGYWGVTPRISNRTANDSAAVADAINKSFGLNNPAPFLEDLNAFWKCLSNSQDYVKCL